MKKGSWLSTSISPPAVQIPGLGFWEIAELGRRECASDPSLARILGGGGGGEEGFWEEVIRIGIRVWIPITRLIARVFGRKGDQKKPRERRLFACVRWNEIGQMKWDGNWDVTVARTKSTSRVWHKRWQSWPLISWGPTGYGPEVGCLVNHDVN